MDTPIPWKIADLIIRQWSKELTPEEETTLREWITSQESNQVFYQKVITGKGFDHFCQQASEHNYRQKYQAFRSHIRKRKLQEMETNRICGSSHTPSFRPFHQPVSQIRAEKYLHSIYGDYTRNISGRPDTVEWSRYFPVSDYRKKQT